MPHNRDFYDWLRLAFDIACVTLLFAFIYTICKLIYIIWSY